MPRNSAIGVMATMLAAVVLLMVPGCQSTKTLCDTTAREKGQLETELARLRAQNQELQSQIKHLLNLTPQTRLENLSTVEKIVISKRSGLYDKDGDGRKRKLIVYVQPLDRNGDAIKAAGSARVRVYNLGGEPAEALLQEQLFGPTELAKLWVGTFLTNYYRLSFEGNDKIAACQKEFTLQVDFTDQLTGKVHSAQRAIRP